MESSDDGDVETDLNVLDRRVKRVRTRQIADRKAERGYDDDWIPEDDAQSTDDEDIEWEDTGILSHEALQAAITGLGAAIGEVGHPAEGNVQEDAYQEDAGILEVKGHQSRTLSTQHHDTPLLAQKSHRIGVTDTMMLYCNLKLMHAAA